uniref:Uncharacterized protein n=1 Tax=Setaria italica TaxID=4555 RepID=K4A3Y1_SETIT
MYFVSFHRCLESLIATARHHLIVMLSLWILKISASMGCLSM